MRGHDADDDDDEDADDDDDDDEDDDDDDAVDVDDDAWLLYQPNPEALVHVTHAKMFSPMCDHKTESFPLDTTIYLLHKHG